MSPLRSIRRRARAGRRPLTVLVLAAVFVLLAYPVAVAADAISNIAPPPQLPSGSLTNAYPLTHYTLDHHFSAVDAGVLSGVDVSGVPPMIAWLLAELTWELTAFLAHAVITLFTFAFSLDLVNGSAATGGAGALEPVSTAISAIYRDTFGEPWLTLAITLTGLWAIWHALVRRRYAETAGALGLSVVFVTIALALVARPEIIGEASKWTNRMSTAFLALSSHGSLDNELQAKQANADQLFKRLVHDPWVVLNFGGLQHCVAGSGDDQRSVPVRPLSRDPGSDAALSRRLAAGSQVQADGKVCINNANKYAPHFLRFAPDSDERKAEYEALRDGDAGKLPDADPGKDDGSYQLGDADKPAADAMGQGGQYQRLLLAQVILLGELGVFALLGAVAVAVILAQVLVLLLLAFAPITLVIGVFPGRGHEFFIGWLSRLASYLLRKAAYSLLLAVLLTVSSALAAATENLGWLLAFGLQAIFHWTILLQRRQLVGQLTNAVTGHRKVESDGLARAAVIAAAVARLSTRKPSPPPASGNDRADSPPSPAPTDGEVPSSPSPDSRDDGDGQPESSPRPDPSPRSGDGSEHGPREQPAPSDPADGEPPHQGDESQPKTPKPGTGGHGAPDLPDPRQADHRSDADSDADSSSEPAPDPEAHGAPDLAPPRPPKPQTTDVSDPPRSEPTKPAQSDSPERRPEDAPTAPKPPPAGDVGEDAREAAAADNPLRRSLDEDSRRLRQPAPPQPEAQPARPAPAPGPSDAEAPR